MATQNPNPAGDPAGQAGGGKTVDEIVNERVSAELGKRLGNITQEQLAALNERPGLANELIRIKTVVDGNIARGRVEPPQFDAATILAEAQKEAGVELDDKTRDVLSRAFGKLAAGTTQMARGAGRAGAEEQTEEEFWQELHGNESWQKDPAFKRVARDVANENRHRAKNENARKMTAKEVIELTKKELDPDSRSGKNTPSGSTTQSQPSGFTRQAMGTQVANVSPGGMPSGDNSDEKPTYRDVVKKTVTPQEWERIVGDATKRFG